MGVEAAAAHTRSQTPPLFSSSPSGAVCRLPPSPDKDAGARPKYQKAPLDFQTFLAAPVSHLTSVRKKKKQKEKKTAPSSYIAGRRAFERAKDTQKRTLEGKRARCEADKMDFSLIISVNHDEVHRGRGSQG